jgi:hypothetical protein
MGLLNKYGNLKPDSLEYLYLEKIEHELIGFLRANSRAYEPADLRVLHGYFSMAITSCFAEAVLRMQTERRDELTERDDT